MRGFRIGAVRQLIGTLGTRALHTENEIYKTASAGVPSILGQVITAVLEGIATAYTLSRTSADC